MANVVVCKTPTTPGSLNWCSGQLVSPGIRYMIYFIPKRDIVKWPALPAPDSSDPNKLAVYAGSFELAVGKNGNRSGLIKKI